MAAEGQQTGLVSTGPAQRAVQIADQLRGRFLALPSSKKTWLGASVAMMVALVLGAAWYAGRPDWRVLFSGLEGKDVQTVSQELAAAGIAFQTTPDGTGIEVAAEQLDKARMEVAAKGMPQTGRLGFELFDKPNWVGSEFDERVNYQRALEGELEHTIGTLSAVRSARVHLVLPQASLFLSEQKPAKASVVLKLKKSTLGAEETESIRNLVAGAVEGLTPEQVTLVDADGRVNLQANARSGAAAASRDEQEAEQALEAKLVAMLEPLAGAGNVRATVNVSLDQGSEERTDEVYDPLASAALSVQKSEQMNGQAAAHAQGVPGTASNAPAAAPAGAVQGSAQAAAPGVPPLLQQPKDSLPVFPQNGAGQTQSVKEESGTYAVTKHLVHSEQGPGRLRRVTAAIVINDRMLTEGVGKAQHTVWRPRSVDELHRLEGLAQAAVGFDEKRGDQVVLENVTFSSNVPELKPEGVEKVLGEAQGVLQAQPGLMKTAMLGLLGVLLIGFVLRPAAKQIVATLKEPAMLQAGQTGRLPEPVELGPENALASAAQGRLEGQADGSPRSLQEELAKRLKPRVSHAVLEQVSEHIRREPSQSTRLLEAWIGSEEEGA